MVRRRAQVAGITTEVCNHTFRGTGITAYLENGGTLEKTRQMAAHTSTRTTQLYDRREDRVTLACTPPVAWRQRLIELRETRLRRLADIRDIVANIERSRRGRLRSDVRKLLLVFAGRQGSPLTFA